MFVVSSSTDLGNTDSRTFNRLFTQLQTLADKNRVCLKFQLRTTERRGFSSNRLHFLAFRDSQGSSFPWTRRALYIIASVPLRKDFGLKICWPRCRSTCKCNLPISNASPLRDRW